MNHDMETPSIVVEPPREELDLLEGGQVNSSTLQVLFDAFGTTSSTTSSDCAEQGLFSAPIDQTQQLSAHISPLNTAGLRDGTAMGYLNLGNQEFEGPFTATSANVFLSASGQNSPIEALSPASTSSGDLFPDSWSDCSSNWSPSHDSSPSSPSLSPIHTGMLNFTINDQTGMSYLEDNQAFQQSAGIQRLRSNSYSTPSDSQPEGSQRTRSASFTNINDFLPVNAQQLSSTWDISFQDTANPATAPNSLPNDFSIPDLTFYQLGSDPSFGVPSSPSLGYSSESELWGIGMQTPPLLQPTYNFAPPEGPPPTHQASTSHSRSHSTHLTVPNASPLQRRTAHRRSHSHTGVHEHGSPAPPHSVHDQRGMFPSVRGRQPSRSLASAGHSRHSSASSHSRHSSTSSNRHYQQSDTSPFLHPIQIPTIITDTSSFLSPALSPSPSSASQSPSQSPHPVSPVQLPDFTGAEAMPTIRVDDSLIRRHTLAGSTNSSDRGEGSSSGANTLHRAASDPIGKNRNKSRPPKARYQGLLRPQKEVDEANQFKDLEMIIDVPVEGIASTSSATSPSSDGDHKGVVASTKIVGASVKRRKDPAKQGRFVCTICGNNFTAKHNLLNHMNSHNGVKPFKCTVCNQTFTTSGTAKLHQNQCTGKQARKRS